MNLPILLTISFFGLIGVNVAFAPYFDLILDRIEIIEQDSSLIDLSNMKVRKINKTSRALSGFLILYRDFDNSVFLEALMYKKMGRDIFIETKNFNF